MRDYGFLMIGYEKPKFIQELQDKIPFEELYTEEDNNDFGIEDETHVTLVPCLDKHLCCDVLKKHLKPLSKYPIILANISKFENDKYDVLKCDVGSELLHQTNSDICSKFPTFTEFKDYHPHMTIAYLKKGMADKYCNDSISPIVVLKPKCFMWSGCDEGDNDININWE